MVEGQPQRALEGVLLGGYTFDGANSYEFTAMPPAERVKRAVEFFLSCKANGKGNFWDAAMLARRTKS